VPGAWRRAFLRATAAALLASFTGAALAQPITGAAPVQPVTVRDDRGVEHRLPAPPRRIVTLLPSLTETAWMLGAGARLVGVDRYSNWPAEIAPLPRLGGLDDAHIEAIAALRPDVVLASISSRAIDRLEALGVSVVRLKSDSHDDVRRTLDVVARLLGRPEAGPALWQRLNREIDAAAARVPAALRGRRVYFEIGGGPYAAGAASFIGETLGRLGLVNIVPAELGPFPKLNPEFVVRARPEVIMGERRTMATVAALAARPGWQALAAVREQRLCGFDSQPYDMLVRPGPRMGEAAGLLADCLTRLAPPAPLDAAAGR
jgi:iron complex transport system substrate-binding protein